MQKLHLKYKIFLGFLIVSLFSLVVGTIGYIYLGKVKDKYDHVVNVNMGNLDKMAKMRASTLIMRSNINFVLGLSKGHEEELAKAFDKIKEGKESYIKADKDYQEIPFVEGEEAVYNKVAESWKKLGPVTDEIVELFKKEGASEKVLAIYFKDFRPASNDQVNVISNLMDFQNAETVKWVNESKAISTQSTQVSIGIMIAAFITSLLLGSFLVKTLTGELALVINELNTASPQLTESASTMSSLSHQLSTCANEQAAAVQETAASLEEISQMVKKNTENAYTAKTNSDLSLKTVQSGQNAVSNMLNAMEDINRNNDLFNNFMSKNSEELTEMVKVIHNISDKTKVINDIVFQTKLLSFNASVEAARAGEQGKGFAVVAEEVGNLAAMSGNAANEIKLLLDESIQKVNQIVSTTKSEVEKLVTEGKAKIHTGVDRARECESALTEINQTVFKVESLVSEVSQASNEQSQGLEGINAAMMQIDEVTNQNNSASQKVSETAGQVMQLSTTIKVTSEKLNELLVGKKAA